MSDTLSRATQRIVAVQAEFTQLARFAAPSIARALDEFGDEWRLAFGELLARCYAEEPARADAIRGYAAFAIDSMRRQRRFEVTRVYPAKTYAEAAAEVYHNDAFMASQYLPGLLLSHYLWPHHFQQLRYFEHFFVPRMAAAASARFAEVGVGTGIYSRTALQRVANATGCGYDISPVSARFAAHHVHSYGLGARYRVELRDVVAAPPEERFDQVLCIEVLEHVEDPLGLLVGLRNLVAADGRLFVTAALNAANADHIYLYRTPQEVLAQLEAAGLHVEHCFCANAYAPPRAGVPVPGAIAVVARPVQGAAPRPEVGP